MKMVYVFRTEKMGDVLMKIENEIYRSRWISTLAQIEDSEIGNIVYDLITRTIKGETFLILFEVPEGYDGVEITEGQKKNFYSFWRAGMEGYQQNNKESIFERKMRCIPYNYGLPKPLTKSHQLKTGGFFLHLFHLGELFS